MRRRFIQKWDYRIALAALVGAGVLGGLVQPSWAQRESEQSPQDQEAQSDQSQSKQPVQQRPQLGEPQGADAGLLIGEVIRTQDGRLTLRTQTGERRTLQVAEGTQITIDGKKAELADLKEGQHVRVRTRLNDPEQVMSVTVSREPQGQPPAGEPRPDLEQRNEPQAAPSTQQQPRQPAQPQQEQPGQARSDQPGGLGVVLESQAAGPGVVISEVRPQSPAAQAGLQPSDRILAVDHQEIRSSRDLIMAITRKEPGSPVQLDVERAGEQRQVEVQLSTRSEALGEPRQQERFAGRMGNEQRAWLGIRLDPEAEQARIAGVYPSGPAARAGLRFGDVIVRLNDQQVASNDDLTRLLEQVQPGESVNLVVQRDGQEETLVATLGNRADFFQEPFYGGPGFARQERGRRLDSQRGFYGGQFQEGEYPEYSMMLEQHRRMAEQHERLESLILDLRDQITQLRQELQAARGVSPPSEGAPAQQPNRDAAQPSAPNPPANPAPEERDRDRQSQRGVEGNRHSLNPSRVRI